MCGVKILGHLLKTVRQILFKGAIAMEFCIRRERSSSTLRTRTKREICSQGGLVDSKLLRGKIRGRGIWLDKIYD